MRVDFGHKDLDDVSYTGHLAIDSRPIHVRRDRPPQGLTVPMLEHSGSTVSIDEYFEVPGGFKSVIKIDGDI
jgi:hypothetical protein